MPRSLHFVASVALVIGLAAAGCAEQVSDTSVDWGSRLPTDSPTSLRTVLDDAVFGPPSMGQDRAAREIAMQDCMEDKGFGYESEGGESRPLDQDLPWFPYSAIPTDFAQEYGYATSTFIVATESAGDEFEVGVTPANQAFAENAPGGPEAWIKAMHEYPDGCLASTEDVGLPTNDWVGIEPDPMLLDAYDRAFEEIQSSDRLADAVRSWQSCMADRGYDQFESRQDIIDNLMPDAYEGSPKLSEVQAREREFAAVDVSCADPVVQAGHQVTAELHAQIVQDHPSDVADALEMWRQAVPPEVVDTVPQLSPEALRSMQPADVVTSY